MGIRLDRNYYDDKTLTLTRPLRNSRIGYDNNVTESNVTATAVAGFPASALGNPLTYELWKPPVFPATIDVDAGRQVTVDYVGLGVHHLGGCKVTVSSSVNGSDYTEVAEAVLVRDRAAMMLFEAVTARYWRLDIEGWAIEPTLLLDFVNQEYSVGDYTDVANAFLGVLFIGQALQMERSFYGNYTPAPYSKDTEIRPTRSEGGQWLGRSVVRKGFVNDYSYRHLAADWVRDTFEPFIDHAVTLPFFISWRPEGYADEVLYGQVENDIQPSNMGIRNLMQVSFQVKAHGND